MCSGGKRDWNDGLVWRRSGSVAVRWKAVCMRRQEKLL